MKRTCRPYGRRTELNIVAPREHDARVDSDREASPLPGAPGIEVSRVESAARLGVGRSHRRGVARRIGRHDLAASEAPLVAKVHQ